MRKRRGNKDATPASQHEKILNVLHTGFRTWADIKESTRLNDDRLGLTLCELLGLRKIWTAQRNGVRVYGIEHKKGLTPRIISSQPRSSDIQVKREFPFRDPQPPEKIVLMTNRSDN